MNVLVIHGPNLNLLGAREPHIYGETTLAEIDAKLLRAAEKLGIAVRSVQHNSEGAIVDELQRAIGNIDGIILNPAAYTHYGYALRDAIVAVAIPTIEVHLSNPQAREDFRARSVVAAVCRGTIAGFGPDSYCLALRALANLLRV